MAEVSVVINGRSYGISCDDGQEQRVLDLGKYVDQRMRDMAAAGAASSDTQLLVLTAILLTDEIYELRDQVENSKSEAEDDHAEEDDKEIIKTIQKLAKRVDSIADRIQNV